MATKRKNSRTARKNGAANNGGKLKWVLRILGVGLVLGVLGIAAIVVMFMLMSRDLPDINAVSDYDPKQVTRLYSADGEVIATWTDQDSIVRTVIPGEDIPDVMRQAMVAAEDAGFYDHPGYDWKGIVRAALTNAMSGEARQGASTITQQVVKNLVLSPERTYRRKIREAVLAVRLDEALTKDEILTIYLNEIFFGVRYYGIEEASQYFFGHSARELELPEAALLAGVVQSPNRYNPFRNPEAAKVRRDYVLRQMYEKGMIEEGVYRDGLAQDLGLVDPAERRPWEGRFPYFEDAVRRQLLEELSDVSAGDIGAAGLHVFTSLDIEAQLVAIEELRDGLRAFDGRHGFHTPYANPGPGEAAERWRAEHANGVDEQGLVADEVYRGVILENDEEVVFGIGSYRARLRLTPESRIVPGEQPLAELYPVGAVFSVVSDNTIPQERLEAGGDLPTVSMLSPVQAAAVVLDPETREVVALVGGYDFGESPFNRAVQARRQVGSSFKPFVYAAALERRSITAATLFQDQPISFRQPNGQTWRPQNYDGAYRGEMSVRRALATSRNVIAVRILDLVGLSDARQFARDAGVEAELPDNLTLALGSAELTPLELTNAFATFAAGGRVASPTFVRRVLSAAGDTLWEYDERPVQGVDPAVAWLTTDLMTSVVSNGTAGRAQRVEQPIAGKTGTTNGPRDAWFVGFSPRLVAGVWVGYDSNQELGTGENGGRTALPVWTEIMSRLHAEDDDLSFPSAPPGIQRVRIDGATGLRAREDGDGYDEYFLEGTAPSEFAPDERERDVLDTVLNRGASDNDSGETVAPQDGF